MNERIKELRKALNLTQAEFGARLGVKGNTITGYENCTRSPSDAMVMSICREFNVNQYWLETGVGEMFEAVTEDEAAAAFFAEALRCEGSIKNKLVHVLAKLDENEWEALASIAAKILEEDRRGKE